MAQNEKLSNFEEFYQTHIGILGACAVTLHIQAFPGTYPPDRSAFEEVRRRGCPLPVESMPADFFEHVRKAVEYGRPFRRLRVLPDPDGLSQQDIKAHADMSRRTLAAGEDVRTVTFSPTAKRLAEAMPGCSYATEYLDGARNGISKNSLWIVRRAMAPDDSTGTSPEALRLMSYDGTGNFFVATHLPPYPEDLAAYAQFWEETFDRHATPLTPA